MPFLERHLQTLFFVARASSASESLQGHAPRCGCILVLFGSSQEPVLFPTKKQHEITIPRLAIICVGIRKIQDAFEAARDFDGTLSMLRQTSTPSSWTGSAVEPSPHSTERTSSTSSRPPRPPQPPQQPEPIPQPRPRPDAPRQTRTDRRRAVRSFAVRTRSSTRPHATSECHRSAFYPKMNVAQLSS